MPQIIVEDGTNVANANSYVDSAYAQAYAAARGLSIPSDDAALFPLLVRGFDYIESQRARFKGRKTYPGGAQWPRTGVDIDSDEIESTAIPEELKKAQVRVAVEIANGTDEAPTITEQVKREKIGPMETEYVTGVEGPVMMAVDALLAPLFKSSGSGFALSTMRG